MISESPYSQARRLRAAIFGGISDASWDHIATTWLEPNNLRWLRENQPIHRLPCPAGMHWKEWNGHKE